jgi:DNA primase
MVHVAERYGFQVERGKIVCPFHDDTRPSCYVYPGDRGYYCFACNAGGDIINFTARLFGLEYAEAAARLAGDMGIAAGADNTAAARLQERRDKKEREWAEWRAQNARLWELRNTPRPTNHEEAALYGQRMGELAYMEYLIEESVYPMVEK